MVWIRPSITICRLRPSRLGLEDGFPGRDGRRRNDDHSDFVTLLKVISVFYSLVRVTEGTCFAKVKPLLPSTGICETNIYLFRNRRWRRVRSGRDFLGSGTAKIRLDGLLSPVDHKRNVDIPNHNPAQAAQSSNEVRRGDSQGVQIEWTLVMNSQQILQDRFPRNVHCDRGLPWRLMRMNAMPPFQIEPRSVSLLA